MGISYVRRFEAAVLLLRHPSSSGPMSRALGSHVLDPDAQVVAPVLNLLSEVDEQPAGDLVLRLLRTERLPLRRAAASVAADKLRRGHFAASSLTVLEEHARHRLRHEDPLEGGLDALDLATQLPGTSFSRLLGAIGDRRVRAQVERAQETGELIPRPQAARVVSDATAAIQADASGDTAEPTRCCGAWCARLCCTPTSPGATTLRYCWPPAPTATRCHVSATTSPAATTTSSRREPGRC